MKRLLHIMRSYWKESALGPLFKLLEATLELLVPLVIAAVVDRGIGGSDAPFAIRMCLLLAVFGLTGLIFSVTAQYFAARAAVGTVTRLRHDLLDHLTSLSYTEMDTLGTSTMLTRMTSDINIVQQGINLTLRLFLRSPFVVFGAMIVAFTIDVPAALTFVAVIPVLSVIVFGIMLISIPLYKSVQAKLECVLLRTRENLSGVRVLRAFCKEKEEIDSFAQHNNELTDKQTFVGRISALLNPLTFVIINLTIVWLIHMGAVRVDGGDLTQGELIALYNLMGQILVELIKLANLIITMTKSVASMHRIDAVFTIPTEDRVSEEELPICPEADAVTFHDVSLTYRGASDAALSHISFSVPRGISVGVIGGTGAGKTSLIGLLARFYPATEGEILLFGHPIDAYDAATLRRRIGIVPQKAVLFHGTLRDNLRWRCEEATDDLLYSALRTAQAYDFVMEKGGLDLMIEQEGRNLSGGQRQRLTIARALVGAPDILIFDDSASALDYATDAALRRAIKEDCADTTVFIIAQRASSLMHADLILTLEDGELESVGAHKELLASSPVYAQIYASQFESDENAKEVSDRG